MDSIVGSKELEELIGSEELKELQDYMKNPNQSEPSKQ